MSLAEVLRLEAVEAAPLLLGHTVTTRIDGEEVVVVLEEVEAYGGLDDPASHAYRGPTPRAGIMFGRAGSLYVYRSYGIHWCMNVVTGAEERGGAVLLRGGRVLAGRDVVERRRGRSDHLTDGPGKLTQALGVDGGMNGTDVRTGPVTLSETAVADGQVEATPRIGISKAVERPWRFVLV